MKLTLIVLAFVGYVLADISHTHSGKRPVLDSATQGPNPQDIATPEPEYIDIDLPEPPRPATVQTRPQVFVPNVISQHEPAPAHIFTSNGYRYKRPVTYYRRTQRIRY